MSEARPTSEAADNTVLAYVPRAASERARKEIERSLQRGARLVALSGPEGAGRTTLLRLLGQRASSDFRCVYIPYAALQAGEICAWILGLLEQPAVADPESALVDAAQRMATLGTSLVVLIDDAGAMPVATARRLAAAVDEATGAIRLVTVLADDVRADRLRQAFAGSLREVRLDEPMSPRESQDLLESLFEHWKAPDGVRGRFDEETVRRLHEASGGQPGLFQLLASEVARSGAGALPEAAPQGAGDTGRVAYPLPDVDPFSPGTEASSYVPRPATERQLADLERSLSEGRRQVLLTGPAGTGKTMVLRVLASRLAGRATPLHMPYPALPPDQFSQFALALLGAPCRGAPEDALLEHARASAQAGSPVVLLIDDATSLPDGTRRFLRDAGGAPEVGLYIVWCCGDDARVRALCAELGPDTPVHALGDPMSEEETAAFLRTRIERARAPGWVHDLFADDAIREIHAGSGGLPAAVQHLADARVRRLAGARTRGPVDDSGPQVSLKRQRPVPRVPATRQRGRRWLIGLAPFAAGLLAGWLWLQMGMRAPESAVPAAVESPDPEAAAPALEATFTADAPIVPTPANPAGPGAVIHAEAREPDVSDQAESAGPDVSDQADAAGPDVSDQADAAGPDVSDQADAAGPDRTVPAAPANPAIVPPADGTAVVTSSALVGAEPAEAPPARIPPVAIHINAIPWARVVIDDREVGITPLGNVWLAPGWHHLRAYMADGSVVDRQFEVDEGHRHLVIER